MKHPRSRAALACAALVGAVLTGCTSEPEPVYQDAAPPAPVATGYDPSLEPSAAALTLVPTSATSLTVTDFDQAPPGPGLRLPDRRQPGRRAGRLLAQGTHHGHALARSAAARRRAPACRLRDRPGRRGLGGDVRRRLDPGLPRDRPDGVGAARGQGRRRPPPGGGRRHRAPPGHLGRSARRRPVLGGAGEPAGPGRSRGRLDVRRPVLPVLRQRLRPGHAGPGWPMLRRPPCARSTSLDAYSVALGTESRHRPGSGRPATTPSTGSGWPR
ncbi:hypothetical protein G5V59_16610 [Nocardioides sp. W3-2-3]|uniref:hypothetical protein n=1 Tax=Nocardioides convexus TaxID=2712224 RepID=UPI00241886E1|nr:hypothetical protein [Nocardioides convexus]NHA00970.1 hypothetical protein [Nocardioides convexus]